MIENWAMLLRDDLVRLIVWMVVDLFRSRTALEAEMLTLRQQINVLRRTAPKKQTFSSIDRLIFICLYRLGVRDALAIVKPETVFKWHRAGFRLYWRWKSKARGGKPTIPFEIRKLIRENLSAFGRATMVVLSDSSCSSDILRVPQGDEIDFGILLQFSERICARRA